MTIGLAKNQLLIANYTQLPLERGSWQPLYDRDEIIGAVLRTQKEVKPVYVSVGHKVDLNQAIDYVIRCTLKYRLPETQKWASG